MPWAPLLDSLPIEEEPVGPSGSSCNYPNVHIQVLTFTPQFLEAARKMGTLEPVTGVGDEAYFHDNAGRFAELYVKVGQRMVTIQKDVDKTSDAEKPGVIALAKALVAKLR